MEIKLFEIRDAATCMPAMAIRVSGEDGAIMRRAGFGDPMVYLIFLELEECRYDPYKWNNRTCKNAHNFIEANWPILESGQVIDVRVILGEQKEPAEAECI